MKLTADTITDEQIRIVSVLELRDADLGDYATPAELARFATAGRPSARRRCAEILNAGGWWTTDAQLRELLADDDPTVRNEAEMALSAFHYVMGINRVAEARAFCARVINNRDLDARIRAMREQASGNTPNLANRSLVTLCDVALGWEEPEDEDDVRIARARCAEILNARGGK